MSRSNNSNFLKERSNHYENMNIEKLLIGMESKKDREIEMEKSKIEKSKSKFKDGEEFINKR